MKRSRARDDRPTEAPPKGEDHLRTIRSILPYLWPATAGPEAQGDERRLRARTLLAVLFLVCGKAANVLVPIVYARAVDALAPKEGPGLLLAIPVALVVGYGLVRLMAAGFNELRNAVFAPVQARAGRVVALSVFRHLHALSMRFHMDRATGGLSRVIERGVRGIAVVLNFMLFNILPTIVEILFVCALLWWMFDVAFPVAIMVTIAAYVAFTLAFTNWRLRFRRQMNETDQEANTKAVDSLLNYETVKYFNNERHEGRRYDESMTRYEAAYTRSETTLNVLNAGQAAIMAAGLTAVMLLAGNGIGTGQMTIGDFVMVNTYLIQLYLPLNILGFAYREIKQGLTDMDEMFALLNVPAEVADRPGAAALLPGPGRVEFRGVRFHYKPDREILHGVSFVVPEGRMLAIVGPTGAGKSTISRVLFRFYDVTGGAVLVDGQDVREVTQDSLRQAIGVVPQDTVLFNDSIGYNIGYGRPGATEAEIVEAAKLAQVHDFVRRLPDGYRTRVGERGLKLSGGEKQRVAIARTILKNPRILILDEATSALDSRTEQEIQAALRGVARGRTTLVIAHRLSTVVEADEILVLDQGRVAERGTHADLVALDGLYAEMWRRQSEAVAAAEAAAAAAEAAAEAAARAESAAGFDRARSARALGEGREPAAI